MSHLTRRQLLAAFGAAAAATATVGLVGCGDDSDLPKDLEGKQVGAMKDYGFGKTFKATQDLEFDVMIMSNPAYPYQENWPFWAEQQARTRVKIKPVVVPIADYNTKRTVMINAGQAPTVIPKTYPPDEVQYIASGAILAVSDYLPQLPTVEWQIREWKLEPDLAERRQKDGKFYILPGLHESVRPDYTLAVRTDKMREVGVELGDAPTWDGDIYNLFKKFRELNPDPAFYPMSDRFTNPPGPGANNLLSILSQAYNTNAGWSWNNGLTYQRDKKTWVFAGSSDEYKAMLTFLHKLVDEKLLDPESFTQDDEQCRQKLSLERSYAASTNAQILVNEYRKDIADIPGAEIAKIPLPIGPRGAAIEGSRLENGVMILSKALQMDTFVALLQWIDWLFYSEEGKIFCKWGVKGETYTGDINDGTFKLADGVDWGGLNPPPEGQTAKHLQVDFGYFNGVFVYGGSRALMLSQYPEEERKYQEIVAAREVLEVPPPAPLTEDERESQTLLQTALTDHVNQNTLKFALGERPLSDWDAYVAECKNLKSDQYVECVNNAMKRFQEERA